MQKALQLEPANSDVLVSAGALADALGKHEQAEADFENALAVDPLTQGAIFLLSSVYEHRDRLDEAENTIRRVMKLNPDGGAHSTGLHPAASRKGDGVIENEKELETSGAHSQGHDSLHAGQAGRSGCRARGVHREIRGVGAYQVAEPMPAQRAGRSLPVAGNRLQNRDPGMAFLIGDTSLRNLHDDPRWEPVLAKMGLLDAWNAMPAKVDH
jgi:tetratricopeptide (TPR) repeat protein